MVSTVLTIPSYINVYYRKKNKDLGHIKVGGVEYTEAITTVKEHLDENKEVYTGSILASIRGGKSVN
jgi:hypothetical protein